MSIIENGKESHVGQVVGVRRFHDKIGFDDYGEFLEVRFWDGHKVDSRVFCNQWAVQVTATVDAPPDVVLLADQWDHAEAARIAKVKAELERDARFEALLADFNAPLKGRIMEVIGGRKSKGAIGKVFWIGPNKFNGGTSVGLALSDQRGQVYSKSQGRVIETFTDSVFVNVEYVRPIEPYPKDLQDWINARDMRLNP